MWRRIAWACLLACVGLTGPCAAASAAGVETDADNSTPPCTAQVLFTLDLPRRPIKGHRPVELSALAYDEARQQLWAASDRGKLFVWQVPTAHPADWTPMRALRPTPPAADGTDAATDDDLNAETLAWRPGTAAEPAGSLWLGTEHGPGAWRLDVSGRIVAQQNWPAALGMAAASAGHGIEAMAWHPRHGLLAGRQRTRRLDPLPAQDHGAARRSGVSAPTRWHAVHAADGTVWRFPAAGRDSQLKALEPLPGNGLLVLERISTAFGFQPILRWLPLDHCGGRQACRPLPVPLQPAPGAGPLNFEGLACTRSGLCWLVSDGAGKAAAPTRVLVLQLQR